VKKQDVVRLGLSGCGSFSGTIANAVKCSTKTELVTCFDLLAGTRRNFSENFDCDQEESYEALVKRDDIDGVLTITPNAVHAEQAVLAARNRKHIFVEKPIANSLADGRRIIEACKEAGITLMVGHYRRRNTGIRKIKEFLENGTLGQPVMVEANVSNHLGFELTPDKFRWRGDDSGCPAGALMTMGIHHVDVFILVWSH
jgi:predicted dehydrogenase